MKKHRKRRGTTYNDRHSNADHKSCARHRWCLLSYTWSAECFDAPRAVSRQLHRFGARHNHQPPPRLNDGGLQFGFFLPGV